MDMKLKKYESLKLVLIAALLILTPLLSTSLRFKYLYFILNILIITAGAEAGLLSFFLHSPQIKNTQPPTTNLIISPHTADDDDDDEQPLKKPVVKVVQKYSSEKINFVGVNAHKLNKSPSTPSIFFIGENETCQEEEEEEEEEEVEYLSGRELFQKSETFIGNFYKQLKIQREESRNKLHHLSHKSF